MNDSLNGASIFWIASFIITGIGYFKIFEKCGVKRIWAFVPIAREYQISLCADRESDGRMYAVLSALSYLAKIPLSILPHGNIYLSISEVVYLAICITILIYLIRILIGLVDVFEKKKIWIFWFIAFEPVATLVWGFSPKFVPMKKVARIDRNKSAKMSGRVAETIDDGLTVNIKERAVIDFFRKRYLLRDIHLTIPKGHMVLLLGGSGAGKTTFLNAVTGYEKAKARIELDEKDVYSEYDSMKYDIGFVPQQDLMRDNDTVMRTLLDAATLRLPTNVSFFKKIDRVKEVLDQFGLLALKSHLVEKLSGGQRKRLSIAMEYISDPSLFILDEPDSGLDGVVARGLFNKLRAIADQGKIVIVITHTPDRVIDLFDDVIVLAKDNSRTGRLAWYGPVDEAYEFFGKDSMEQILLSINQVEEGGEGKANEFVEKYEERVRSRAEVQAG